MANPLVGLRVARVTRANVVALTRAKSKGRRANELERDEEATRWNEERESQRMYNGGMVDGNAFKRVHTVAQTARGARESVYRIAVIAWGGCSKAASSGKRIEGEREREDGWSVGWLSFTRLCSGIAGEEDMRERWGQREPEGPPPERVC